MFERSGFVSKLGWGVNGLDVVDRMFRGEALGDTCNNWVIVVTF